MYQNSFHELVDIFNKKKKIHIHEDFRSSKQLLASVECLFSNNSFNQVCFSSEWDHACEMSVIPEMVRLPYADCWFEANCEDNGLKIGYLCRQKDDEIFALIFEKDNDNPWALVSGVLYFENQFKILAGFENEKFRRKISWLSQFLSTLNCCNITRTEHKPKPSQQSVRRALGRQPLFSTWTLEIDLERTERELPGESYGGHTSKRLHLCRGHARQHKPGKWCWVRAHVRGDKSLGMIHKDYATH